MTVLFPELDANPFSPILDTIAKHGVNEAPIPVASAYEYDPETKTFRWTVDVEVRFPLRRSFDCTAFAETLPEALRKALHYIKRELPK